MNDLDKIIWFLRSTGLSVEVGHVESWFLTGINITGGRIIYNPDRLDSPGDLLHEAGHIAVTPAIFRKHLTEDSDELARTHYEAWYEANPNWCCYPENPLGRHIMQSSETEAIAWSYAAAVAAGVDTFLPFAVGFQDEGEIVHEQLAMGMHFGIHGLFHAGMTRVPNGVRPAEDCFPNMIRWLQI